MVKLKWFEKNAVVIGENYHGLVEMIWKKCCCYWWKLSQKQHN